MNLNPFRLRSLTTRGTLLTLLIFVISTWSTALYSSRMQREDMQTLVGQQQFSTVTGIAHDIDGRLRDRMQALETISKEVTPRIMGNNEALQSLLEQRPLLRLLFNGGVFITRTDGTAIADVPVSSGRIGTNYIDRESVSIPLREGRTVIGRPAMGKKLRAPIFSIVSPIFDSKGQVSGVVVGTINLGKPSFLDQIAQTPYGQSGGYLLIAPQHQLIVTASDKTRVMQPAPTRGLNAMHDRYMDGYEGFGTAVSSRGIEELSAAKSISSAGWFIAVTLPVKEAFAPIDRMLQRLFFSALLFTLVAGTLTWWLINRVLRQQFAPIHAASQAIALRANADHPMQVLPIVRDDEIGQLIGDFNILLKNYSHREELLRASESFKDVVLNSMNAEIAVVDHSGVIRAVNERWTQFSAENSAEPGKPAHRTGVGTNYLSVCGVASDDAGALAAYEGLQSVLDGRSPSFDLEYRCEAPQQQRWFSMMVTPLGQGVSPGAVITHTDITDRKLAEAKLELAASVFDHSREAIMIVNTDGTIVDINAAFTRITGFSREEAMGQNPRILSSGRQGSAFYGAMWGALIEQGHWIGEIWNRRKNGEVYAELLTISAVCDSQGSARQYVALFSDITAIKEHQRQLEHIAHFDALTNLPNRLLLADRLQQAIAQAQRRGQHVAVAYLDLDGFKSINDRYGHSAGDQLLIHLATTMKDTLREGDTLARLGGDEFVAVLIDLDGIDSYIPMLTRLLGAASAPVQLGDVVLQVSASIGVTVYPQEHEIEADQLLRQADQAMYQAKLAGKNNFHVFDAAQDVTARVHRETLERIRLALARHEFVLHYQPKVNLHSGKVIGAEALIRWLHPEKGLLSPAAFLPIIEDHPLSVEVGEWVIDTALAQIEAWHAAGLDLPVSVNIGARQLQQSNFVERLLALLANHREVNPVSLELEVLETSALADMAQVSQVIEDCARIGVKFALDDFGTGYSSLTYLKRLRVSMLKIDQSFVRDMLEDPDDLTILEGIIGLAAAFKRDVIAEGVETVAHGTALLHLGCELAQGYGIARPMPAEQLPAWVASWQPDVAWTELPWLGGNAQSLDE
ncbi:MAG: EAL domain-containing protein [Rhodoferax sp.]|nr:EAL domain-containing protein [Rhodoferax sp.]